MRSLSPVSFKRDWITQSLSCLSMGHLTFTYIRINYTLYTAKFWATCQLSNTKHFVHMYWYIKNFLLIISLSRTILFTYGCRKYFFLSYKIIVFYFTQYFQISFFRYFSLKKYFSPILILIPFYNIKISFICKVFWILFETDCFGSSSFQ